MKLEIFDLGLVDFKSAWDFQKNIFLRVKQGKIPSALILCRHLPVITLGRKANQENILAAHQELEALNIQTYEIERGGDVTYHGPGQLCAYPILNLSYFKKDINWLLRSLEAMLVGVLSEFGVKAQSLPGLTGVWIAQKKIASIAIAIKSWISFHGISLNIKSNDLRNFYLIRPCGLDIIMTSMESELKQEIKIDKVKASFLQNFNKTLKQEQR
ncbi:MAG: lipoyl(octanoyl) transferase LipB [Candidatus Omnitrophota bacterium]